MTEENFPQLIAKQKNIKGHAFEENWDF
jgi:hypothetical protein